MVRLSWIAFELGSATGLPRKNIIPQKRRLDEGQSCGSSRVSKSTDGLPVIRPDSLATVAQETIMAGAWL
jgi:hypothetical protein